MDNGASSYRRFLDGDESGIVEIVRDYKDGLILYLNTFVNDIYAAEDLAEDTFVRLLIKRPRDSGRANFKTWLYTIGRNLALNYLRSKSKREVTPVCDLPEQMGELETLEENFIKNEQKLIVHKALGKINENYRQIIWLVYFENFSQKEAAQIMKKSVHSIETLVYRARKALKNELEKEGFVYEEL